MLGTLGLNIKPEESADYQLLLAAVHDCAERVMRLPDYQPTPDLERYPRENVRLPTTGEQILGHAWAHRSFARGRPEGTVLRGKTVCLKDCIAVAGVPQFFGSDAFPAWTPSTDATVVTRVLDAGADILGTATCEHFCNSTASFTSAQGTVENPYASGYSSGGSTSGGAALVGAGLVDIAIGTDQGGSIRVPASLSGCVGLKPTHGLIPYTGITSGDPIDDHVGPLARSVADIAACLDAIAGHDNIDDRSVGAGSNGSYNFVATLQQPARLDGVKIAILKEAFDQPSLQEPVRQRVLEAAQHLQQLGATMKEISVPLHTEGPSIWVIQQRISGSLGILGRAAGRRGLQLTEFEHARLPWTDATFEKLFPSTKNTVINGLYLLEKFPGLYSKTINIGRQIRDAYDNILEEFDVIVMPTTPMVAPRHGPRDSVLGSFEPSIGVTSNTAVFNVTGHPALSLPVGFAPAADRADLLLPVGMQLVGSMWQEKTLLRVGHAWERTRNWKEQSAEPRKVDTSHRQPKRTVPGVPRGEIDGNRSPKISVSS
ncbi:Amidase [Tolypocladium ophioglossoides CBS 100239]|uniref:Amidase n=1 Tax=Tolypocladium ophioglossoides (strain CBS 100239) TaxID=1163406 RepID=A0A0L0MXZ0_TOLOC|nr:Amidase [Tolypocladium ophioglossoides CBS 100239]